MTPKLKNTKLLKIIQEETLKVVQEQQDTEELLAQVEKEAAETGLEGQPLKAYKHLRLQKGLDHKTALERAEKVAKMYGTEEKNPDYNPSLSKLLQVERNGLSIAEMLFNLGQGNLPAGQLGDIWELKSILKNNKATRNKQGRLLVFTMETILNDMLAQAKVKKDPDATYTIVTNGKEEKKKYASKILKDDVRKKLGDALTAMVPAFSIDPSHPNYKEIFSSKGVRGDSEPVNEGNIFTKFWMWVRKTIDDIKDFVLGPISGTLNFIEQVIRSGNVIYRLATDKRMKTLAAGIVFPSYVPDGAFGMAVGHAALLLIIPESEEEDNEDYKIKIYDFGRYTRGGGDMKVTAKDYNKTKAKYGTIGTVRQGDLTGFGKLEWNRFGNLTDETQTNIMMALRKNTLMRKYARKSDTKVAWLKDIDPKKAEEEARRFPIRPYGLFFRNYKKFGYFKNEKPVTVKNEVQIENCATFVLKVLNSADLTGGSISSQIRAKALATPDDLINLLSNEFDEEVTTYGTSGGAKALQFRKDMERDDGLFDFSGQNWEEIAKKAATRGVVKPGSAITFGARRRGATNQEVYAALARALPAKVFEDPYFKGRWNKGKPGKRTKRLIAMYQISKKLPEKDIDGRLGKDTWELLKNE